MRYGMCSAEQSPEIIEIVKKAGYDYIECRFWWLARLSDEEFADYQKLLEENELPCEAANCFIPGEFKLINNPELNVDALKAFVETGMKRCSELGVETVVFGSGGARSIPEGVDRKDGLNQLTSFLRDIIAPIAEKYEITVVIEPLSYADTNVINTIKEGADLAASTGSKYISDLCDLYHMVCVGEDVAANIRALKGSIKHAHIACALESGMGITRLFPRTTDEYDYQSFIDALEYAGCPRCSVEAGCRYFNLEASLSAKVLRSLK